ncbi:MAG TPA: DUF2971 domain-containing protein [Verrucomicrobiae bacterium]|nr:DUF2971 domain-containing protein [Verrucomicrobiae bacterium]
MLKDLRIRASIPNTLNDPFELSPNIDPAQFTQKKCETFLRQDHEIDHWYQREGSQLGFTNKKAFKRSYLKDLPRRAAKLLPQVPQNVEQVRKNFANDFSEAWRIICCSLVRDSILMWSHYADNHTGLALELETNEDPFSSIPQYIRTVKYSEKKPEFIYTHEPETFAKAYLPVAATKALAWAYEKEVRIILPREPLKDGLYVPISPACIKGVYLGCRSSLETKELMRSALCNPKFQNVKLAKAEVNPSQYELTFVEVT